MENTSKIQIFEEQSLLDIAVRYYGNAEAVFDIAIANGISVTDILTAKQIIKLPKSEAKDEDIKNYYQSKGIQPATSLSKEVIYMVEDCQGVGCWRIGYNFEIS